MVSTIIDRFVEKDFTVPDFDVEATRRVCANPSFVMYGRPLASKVRKGDQLTLLALLAPG